MNYYIIIPVYNEEKFISALLDSVLIQTLKPKKVIVVNDNSTDNTAEIITEFEKKSDLIHQVLNISKNIHLPGSKIVRAFEKGLELLDEEYDFIVKLDADLILPENYFEYIAQTFIKNPKVGIAGGFAYILKNNKWVLENLTDKHHVRGVFKAYRKACFIEIGGLKPAMGWDTVDELLCRYYGWEVETLSELKVKHFKPTGANYSKSARYNQGEAFYVLGYGLVLTFIASIKLALRKKKPLLFIDYIEGYFIAKKKKLPLLVTDNQAKFVKEYRWKKIREKLFK